MKCWPFDLIVYPHNLNRLIMSWNTMASSSSICSPVPPVSCISTPFDFKRVMKPTRIIPKRMRWNKMNLI